jgi:phosphate-selective porin OprO/OprP
VGLITVGHHYEPFGREVQTSSKYITFMERSLVAQLAPERSTGISVANSFGDNWDWRIGAFRASNSYGDDTGNLGAGEWAYTARIEGQLWSDDNGSLSGGLSGSYRNEPEGINAVGLRDEFASTSIRGGSHMLPSLAGSVVVDGETKLWGADLAYLRGPWHAMAEYATADVNAAGGSADLDAWAAQVGYFITGETRGWKDGDFSRTTPAGNYGDGDNVGAWEVAVRYDTADLDNGGVTGVEMDQWTLGLNWYLNPNTRVMLNYGEADYDGIGEVEFFGMRFAIDF